MSLKDILKQWVKDHEKFTGCESRVCKEISVVKAFIRVLEEE